MSYLCQITSHDCWISATILAIFMGISEISSITVQGTKVIFPNKRIIILKSNPKNYQEAIIRATRVYFSDPKMIYQSGFLPSQIDHFGSPDLISELFFGKHFQVWSTSRISFYPKISRFLLQNKLEFRDVKVVFLITFDFNPDHLYVYESINKDTINVLDVSNRNINKISIDISKVSVLFELDLSDI